MTKCYWGLGLLLWTTVLIGQRDSVDFQPYLEIGVHYHYTQTRVEFLSPTYATDYYQGFAVGLSLRQATEKIFGFQMELSYARRGWEESFDTLAGKYQRQVDYIQFTPMTQFSIGKRFYAFLNAGPYLSIPLADNETAPPGLNLDATNRRFYYNEPLARRWQYGLTGGPGFGILLSRLTIQVEGRYVQGFNGIFEADLLTANSSRPNAIGFGAVLLWRL